MFILKSDFLGKVYSTKKDGIMCFMWWIRKLEAVWNQTQNVHATFKSWKEREKK